MRSAVNYDHRAVDKIATWQYNTTGYDTIGLGNELLSRSMAIQPTETSVF